jgi:hypothetical protein
VEMALEPVWAKPLFLVLIDLEGRL